MSKKIFIVTLLFSSFIKCLSQDLNSIKGYTWKCINVKGGISENYKGSKLTLNSDSSFLYYHAYPNNEVINEVSGTYQISTIGIISFPTSRLKTTMLGKTTDLPCISDVEGNNINFCMLSMEIKIISSAIITMTIKAAADTEITNDIILTLKRQ